MLKTLGSYVGWGSGADASNPGLININETKFNPQDASHINFIDERLQNFLGKRDALLSIDKKMELAMPLLDLGLCKKRRCVCLCGVSDSPSLKKSLDGDCSPLVASMGGHGSPP